MNMIDASMGFLPSYCWQRPKGITGLYSRTYFVRLGFAAVRERSCRCRVCTFSLEALFIRFEQ